MSKTSANGLSGNRTQACTAYLNLQNCTNLCSTVIMTGSLWTINLCNRLEGLGAKRKEFGVVGEVLLVGAAEIIKRPFLQHFEAALCFWT